MPEPTPDKPALSDWKEQAKAFRAPPPVQSLGPEVSPYGLMKQVLVWILLGISLGGAFLLLLFPGLRQYLLSGAAVTWSNLSRNSASRVYDLPPPPLKTVEARTIEIAPRIIVSEEQSSTGSQELEWEEPVQAPVVLTKDESFRAGYQLLIAGSQAAGQLARNEVQGFLFTDWKPVNKALPQVWIELVAVEESTGREVSFTWLVDTEDGRTQPLSQVARDLEARVRVVTPK